AFDALGPEKTAAPLIQGLNATRQLLERLPAIQMSDEARDQVQFLVKRKENQFASALIAALSLDLDAAVQPEKPATGPFAEFASPATFNRATAGQSFAVKVRLVNRGRIEVKPVSVKIAAPQG